MRDALVRTRTGYIAVIRSLLRQHGYRVPSGRAEAFIVRVRALPLPERLLSEIAPLLARMRHVNQQVAYSDTRIEALTTTDPRVRLLRTVPSVGPVTAAAFVAALDEVTRFRGAHEVEAYLGLVPRELSSGERQHRGRITKAGPSRVRRLLVQAAVSILRLRDPRTGDLREWAMAIAARRGKKIAVVALARAWPKSSTPCCATAPATSRDGRGSLLPSGRLYDGTLSDPPAPHADHVRRARGVSWRCGGSANVALATVAGRSVDAAPPPLRLPECRRHRSRVRSGLRRRPRRPGPAPGALVPDPHGRPPPPQRLAYGLRRHHRGDGIHRRLLDPSLRDPRGPGPRGWSSSTRGT